jgi:uncharacterized protein YndB with AHSA1/START domain
MIDVAQQISSVRREVGGRSLESGEVRTVTVSQTYDAPLEDVWSACTEAERIARWFLPVSGDLRLGGRYQLEGNAGGTIETCDPPRAFSATWEFRGAVSWIELRLTPEADGRTRFALEHIIGVEDPIWDEYGPGAVGVGWDMALSGLCLHLASGGDAVDPAAAAAWMTSDEGREFVRRSSRGWGDAAVAAGADEAKARAAQELTTTAYTVAPEPATEA